MKTERLPPRGGVNDRRSLEGAPSVLEGSLLPIANCVLLLLRRSNRAHHLPAGGTDRISIGVSVRDPLLAAQRDYFDTFDVAADDVLLAYVVGEAVVVAITLVEADVRLLRRGGVGHDAEPTTMRADGIRPWSPLNDACHSSRRPGLGSGVRALFGPEPPPHEGAAQAAALRATSPLAMSSTPPFLKRSDGTRSGSSVRVLLGLEHLRMVEPPCGRQVFYLAIGAPDRRYEQRHHSAGSRSPLNNAVGHLSRDS